MKAIAAMDPHRVIGNKGILPWPSIREDFQFFKQFTMGKQLVMGKTTFLSIPPLKGRKICVVTSDGGMGFNPEFRKKCDLLSIRFPYLNADGTLKYPPYELDDAIVVGGAKTYKLFLPYCTDVYVTHIFDEYSGDSYMPYFEDMFPNQEIIQEAKNFWIVRYFK